MSFLLCMALLAGVRSPASAVGVTEMVPVVAPVDFGKLKSQLSDRDARKRREAVKGLIELGTEEAWLLVLDSLADEVGQVADEAQLGLSDLPEALHSELFGKRGLGSKRGIVALRVAEAIGRIEASFPAKRYVKALGHRDEAVRRSVLWSLERLAGRDRLTEQQPALTKQVLKMASKDKIAGVKSQALVTLAALDEALALPLALEFLRSKSTLQRTAAAELLRLIPKENRSASFSKLAADEALSVRLSAYEAAANLGTLDAMSMLVGALETEPRPRGIWRLVDLLRAKSGLNHRTDPRPWKDWLAKQAEDWTPAKEAAGGEIGESGTTSLVGMRVISDRVSFLVDFSGSMWEERAGVSRKQRVDVEMRKALEGLAPGVMFNVHPYATDSKLWEKKLVPANKRNVKKAVEFFESCSLRGKGDFWSAMQLALQDPDVDTLMVLGDGAPSGGPRWNMVLMKELFAHENRFRRITLDVLLVDCSGFLASQWEAMSKRSGGRCLGVEL